ncbi:prostaglandin E2 receptor EP4 subtype-like isoform X2 [Haliotis asinina]|uniref:prostaglandin E2 receptor EP4 subtype-like isoform X2 n=1 Tax=Haliotis asinina TaxID=109174 RepID=UPI003531EFCE
MEVVNSSFVNSTMLRDVDALCKDSGGGNATCNKQALGINLSTPILMLSTGVLGNVLALVVLYTSKKEVRKTVFFTMLAGLAWTDVIGQMCAGPIAIITYANNLQWQGGDPVCKYHGFTMMRRTRRINNSPSIDRRLRVSGHRHRNILEMEMETQMVWFLGAITIVFCTCYAPLNVHILTNQITGQIDVKKDLISIRLASINQILDPWLYILLRKAMFFKFLRRVKQFVAQRKRPSSSRRHFAAHMEGSQNGSFPAYQLHSVSGAHENSHHSLNECVYPEKNHIGSTTEPTTRPELRDITLNGSSDSEMDVFVEPQIRTKASFISIDEYIAAHRLKRRDSSGGGDINGNKKLQRLYSLPAYLKGTENDGTDS